MHVLLLSLLATVKNVKLQCKVLGNHILLRCLTPFSNRECFGLIQDKKLRCISNRTLPIDETDYRKINRSIDDNRCLVS